MENVRAIIDYADEDEAKELRDALYAELQDRVMNHIETHKQVVASNMFNKNEQQVDSEPQETETQNT